VQYKKYGKFVPATIIDDSFILDKSPLSSAAQRLAQLRPGLIIEPGSPAALMTKAGSGKTRAAFYLRTTPMTRASRRLCRTSVRMHHHARCPGKLIDLKSVKAETYAKAAPLSNKHIQKLNSFTARYVFLAKCIVEMNLQVPSMTLHKCNFTKSEVVASRHFSPVVVLQSAANGAFLFFN
jgi:hypothetical protein